MSEVTFTWGPLTDEQLHLELTWAYAELETLQNRLFNAEYQSQEWDHVLHDLPIVRKRVSWLMRALNSDLLTS